MSKTCKIFILFLIVTPMLFAGGRKERGSSAPVKTTGPVVIKSTWPKMFSMETCLEYARLNSPKLKQVNINYADQVLNTIIERSEFDFQLLSSGTRTVGTDKNSYSAGLSKKFAGDIDLSINYDTIDKPGHQVSDSGSFSVSLSKQILGGSSFLESDNGINDSLIDEAIKLNLFNKEKRALILQVKQNFNRVIRSKQTLYIQKLRLKRSKRNLEHAVERENPLDIATARLQVPESQIAVLAAQREVEAAKDKIKLSIGMPVSDPLKLDNTFNYIVSKLDVEADIKFTLKNHEDILNSQLTHKKLVLDRKIQKSHLLPDIELDGTYSRAGETGQRALQQRSERVVGVSLSWPLWERADRAKLQQVENSLKTQLLEIFNVEQERTFTVRSLGRRLQESVKVVALQQQRVKVAEHQLLLLKDRWENGEIDILEFIRSQNDIERDKVQLINLKTAYMDLLADYMFQTGKNRW